MVGKEIRKTDTKAIPKLMGVSADECMRLEDEILERALVLWHKKGQNHRNALKALLQAEREIFTQKKNELKAVN